MVLKMLYTIFLSTGSLVAGLSTALGHRATARGYVGSRPSSFAAIALFAMHRFFAPLKAGSGPDRFPACANTAALPGYHAGSASTCSRSCRMAFRVGLPPPIFCTLGAILAWRFSTTPGEASR
jgi:hypothetical protein